MRRDETKKCLRGHVVLSCCRLYRVWLRSSLFLRGRPCTCCTSCLSTPLHAYRDSPSFFFFTSNCEHNEFFSSIFLNLKQVELQVLNSQILNSCRVLCTETISYLYEIWERPVRRPEQRHSKLKDVRLSESRSYCLQTRRV